MSIVSKCVSKCVAIQQNQPSDIMTRDHFIDYLMNVMGRFLAEVSYLARFNYNCIASKQNTLYSMFKIRMAIISGVLYICVTRYDHGTVYDALFNYLHAYFEHVVDKT